MDIVNKIDWHHFFNEVAGVEFVQFKIMPDLRAIFAFGFSRELGVSQPLLKSNIRMLTTSMAPDNVF